MSQSKVYSGYVVGSDLAGKSQKEVWKVRVNDGSNQDQKKFEVATTYVLLTQGLLVDFRIGSMLVGKRMIKKAVEVTVK